MKKSKESMDPDFDIFEVDYSEEFDRIVAKRRAIRWVSVLIPAVAACLALTLFLWPDKPDAAIPVMEGKSILLKELAGRYRFHPIPS